MKRIMLHIVAFAAMMPCVVTFSFGSLWASALGLLYIVYLFIYTTESERGRRFLRDYWREIHRLERMA